MNEPAFACVKYDGGYSSYYEVLIQQNYLFAEPAESTTLQQKIHALVLLYKSLGGGWQTAISFQKY